MSNRLARIAEISYGRIERCAKEEPEENGILSLRDRDDKDVEKLHSVPPGPARRALRPLRRSTCPLSSRDVHEDRDLRMEDLEQRIEAAVEAVRDAVAILEGAGMGRGEAALKLVALVKSEIEDDDDGLPGGFGDNLSDKAFDPEQLAAGIVVELEHTNDPELAKEITKDHLRELPDYYTRLKEMEEEGEKELKSEAAEFQGQKVKLNDPTRNPSGSKKKFHVFVKDPKSGKVKKIQFGDPKMEIKRDDPERRKSFRARHKCDSEEAKDKTKAKYWSCYQWRKGKKVDN